MRGLTAVCMVLVIQSTQGHGLLDSARRNGGKSTVVIDVEPGLPSFSDVVTQSAVIVRGTVRGLTTRLSDDQEDVVTRFEVVPARVYKGNIGATANKPGPTQPLIVQRLGGDLTSDGLQLGTHVSEFPEKESFREGEDVFLFLSPDAVMKGVFTFTDGSFGAYRIVDERVTAMTKRVASTRGEQSVPLAAFENRVQNLIRK